MKTPTPYRSLPSEKRVALITHVLRSSREARANYIRRLADRPGGFRVVTLQSWPVDRLAKEIVRLNAQSSQDEVDLLHLHYVELEPEIQITFLEAAGVPHEKGVMPDELDPPYTDAEAVRRGAAAVRERHGEDGERYLRTIALYNPEGWPGVRELVGGEG